MREHSPAPISAAELAARFGRVEAIAPRLGFVGAVEYRHVFSRSGGAQYGRAAAIEQDLLIVDAGAFRRDEAADDFSLDALIAHERGHQLLCRHERLRRNVPQGMSVVTEEIVASLIGAVIADKPGDGQALIMKALAELVERGLPSAAAVRQVEAILTYLEAVL